uniref:Uncharacterized protein n=1 Tax=Mola mola TaxID=94237 RepID=A0A3Q3WNQ1_MOLML
RPSCRYNCGYNLGSCSCSSSCQYYGNCCRDYYYCPVTTTSTPEITSSHPTGNSCGGYLVGSGTFSSPNHPNYYYDNLYCTWKLKVSSDQRIFLSFTYLLPDCCSCDYIAVYDGPSVNSQYLGKVCNTTLNSFYSSSNSLTVLFRTDGSAVGRGFKAHFTNSLPPRVDCSSDNMTIVIDRKYLNSLGHDGHSLYLNDPSCRPQVSRYQVVFSFPITMCGNVRQFESGRVIYTNSLRADTSNYGEITRQAPLKLNVGCRMEQDSVSQIMYLVENTGNSSIISSGRFNTSMHFYTSSSFYYKRCTEDSTYRAYVTGTRPYARFRFKAFQFLRATESVYMQCKVLICQASDGNSRCRRGCSRRKARDLGSEHDSQTLVLGPIQLRG